jgi:hypothetical protein
MDEREGQHRLIERVDPDRRDFVRRILGDSAFVSPLIATFSIDGLTAVWVAPPCGADPGGGAQT